ncbi:MAG TPA: UbiD family decarboxylase [Pirellulales bacterium]|jgi:4-hydroxy-3-polyprenylbenzoate decarboxylase|nr:UbiD family decarboxylase [Pirellulales bacterium]
MTHHPLRECVDRLAASGQLVRIEQPIDARLEAAAIHRRVQQAGGPALLFANVKGCRFPMVSNLFGTLPRARSILGEPLERVRRLIELRSEPQRALRSPSEYLGAAWGLWHMWPRRVAGGPATAHQITLDQLPQLQSWPLDGGAFITLPLVYTEDAARPGLRHSNLGMYRIQLSGGQYRPNQQVGLHYQIHRGIAVHHAAALAQGQPLKVNVFVGGSPAMALAAVMPLPEGMSELSVGGALAGRRIDMIDSPGALPIYSEADFTLTGTVETGVTLPEGPFGDHLGYYSLAHAYPVIRIDHVYHRPDAIWPFTVVGRPPQEDTIFGQLIHELTGPAIPSVVPGVHAVHAVDATGVHPLLLAIGSERYVPYARRERPAELLTLANAVLGQGQLSLAKYLWIVAREDDLSLDVHDVAKFLQHVLARVDWRRDLHFQTCWTIDTLDYSGSGLNEGSKLVIAAAGPDRRDLPTELGGLTLPDPLAAPRLCLPGVLAVEGPAFAGDAARGDERLGAVVAGLDVEHPLNRFPLVVVVDDSEFAARSLNNFLWTTFTRSNPAADVHGVGSFVEAKHWGCRGSLVIDARAKPHHAPMLAEDPAIERRVEALAAPGGPLHGLI